MVPEPAVGVHDDLSAGHAAISQGTTGYEPARGIDKKLGFLIEHFRGDDRLDYLLDDCLLQGIVIDIR